MTTYQTLCQLFDNKLTQQRTFEQQLYEEIQQLQHSLAAHLGLVDKYYRTKITDEQATQPYVRIDNTVVPDSISTYPEILFDLTLVLETSEEVYPKMPYTQRLKAGFIQADRLYFSFVEARPEVYLSVNLRDDKEVKYRAVVQAYLDLLTKQLSKVG